MLRNQVLALLRRDRENQHVAAVIGCTLAAGATPTFIWVALVGDLPFMFGVGVLAFAVTSTLSWYQSFHLHRPAKYCVIRPAVEQQADAIHPDIASDAGEGNRSIFVAKSRHHADA
ncbi:hypothetical protein A5724_12705 [Mycobacterium sp. ACS1612]|nr:hypothetical protein A5724_12705 [Mycobacterium sp. ACS1612]